MLNKIINVIKKNIVIIICILVFILFCIYIKTYHFDFIHEADLKVHEFFHTRMISESSTEFMKNITSLGSWAAIAFVLLVSVLLFKNKIVSAVLSLDLILIGFINIALKNFFKGQRPTYGALIDYPSSYSFPSGHVFFSVGFYGLITYFIWKTNINKFYKYIITFVISMLVVFIAISRIYLGVHYLSDVLSGFILGVLSIILLIGVYLSYEWKWLK